MVHLLRGGRRPVTRFHPAAAPGCAALCRTLTSTPVSAVHATAFPQLVVDDSGSIGGSSCRTARQPPSMSPLIAAPAAIAEPAPTSIHVARCFRRLFTEVSPLARHRLEQARCPAESVSYHRPLGRV